MLAFDVFRVHKLMHLVHRCIIYSSVSDYVVWGVELISPMPWFLAIPEKNIGGRFYSNRQSTDLWSCIHTKE